MLFKTDKQNKIFLHPEAVGLYPILGTLSADEVLFVALVYDYQSPFHQFAEDERLRRASLHIWADNRIQQMLDKQKVRQAIEAYKALQYNSKQEVINTYNNKIALIQADFEGLTSPEMIKKSMEAIKMLRVGIRELEQEVLEAYQEENVLIGGGKRSFLEEMMANKAKYESVIKIKK